MKLHERVMLTQKAAADLGSVLNDWLERNDLTWNEAIRILMDHASRWMVYPIRIERHGEDSDKRADEA